MRLSTLIAAALAATVLTAAAGAFGQPAKPADLSTAAAELEARVAKLEASGETNTLAIAQISTRLAELTQRINALGQASGTNPDLVNRVDAGAQKVAELEREIEALRTQLADLEQPYAAEGGGGAVSGFTLEAGGYSATVNAYMQTRWQLLVPSDFATITESTYRIRRGRVGLKGNAGTIFDKKMTYKFLAEFIGEPALRDYYIDLELRPELSVRAGQAKVQHVRSFLVGSTKLLFTERSAATEAYRYDRDVGLWAHGKLLSERLHYSAGITNGGGANERNDNIDFALSARVQGAVLGKMIGYTSGDIAQTAEPAITVGASIVHDLVRVPDTVGGVVIGERDVDSDEVIDNVRVLSLAADATLRMRGAEVGLEGFFRRESWGTILDHSSNEEASDLIDASSAGNKNYVGAAGQVSYFVWPKTVAVGGRFGYSHQTYLGVGGRSGGRPAANRLFEFDLVGQLFSSGKRLLGLHYTLTNFNATVGDDPQFDIEHRFILETQLLF